MCPPILPGWETVNHCHGSYSWEPLYSVQHLTTKSDSLVVFGVQTLQRNLHRQDILGLEPEVFSFEANERLDHKAGTNQQDHGKGHGEYNKAVSCTIAVQSSGRSSPRIFQGDVQVKP